MAGAGRPHGRRRRHWLRAGKPAPAHARACPRRSAQCRCASCAHSSTYGRTRCRRLAPAGDAKSGCGVAYARHRHPQWFEHMYLVARAVLRAGRGGRPDGARWHCVPQDAEGVAASRCVAASHRRAADRSAGTRQGGPAGVPGLLDAVRAGACGSPTTRDRRCRGAGACCVPAGAVHADAGRTPATASVPTLWLGEERARSLVQQNPTVADPPGAGRHGAGDRSCRARRPARRR